MASNESSTSTHTPSTKKKGYKPPRLPPGERPQRPTENHSRYPYQDFISFDGGKTWEKVLLPLNSHPCHQLSINGSYEELTFRLSERDHRVRTLYKRTHNTGRLSENNPSDQQLSTSQQQP